MKKQLNVNKEYVLHYFENKGAKSRDEIEKAFALSIRWNTRARTRSSGIIRRM